MRIFISVALCLVALSACRREERNTRPSPAYTTVYSDAARQSDIQPGGRLTAPTTVYPAAGSALQISEGQRLYSWYNCSGCHSNGGGGIGPPLIKSDWIYGGEPANMFDTIVKGRPNGMPAWGGRIPEYQIWEIIAYVRSLNQLEPQSATAARADAIQRDPSTIVNKVQGETK